MLPAEVAAELVHQPGHRPHDGDGVGIGLDVGGRQQALLLEVLAEQAERLRQLRHQVQRVLQVRARLQDAARATQLRLEPAKFAGPGIGGRQGAGPQVSPSILSKSSCCDDIPTNPACSAAAIKKRYSWLFQIKEITVRNCADLLVCDNKLFRSKSIFA